LRDILGGSIVSRVDGSARIKREQGAKPWLSPQL